MRIETLKNEHLKKAFEFFYIELCASAIADENANSTFPTERNISFISLSRMAFGFLK